MSMKKVFPSIVILITLSLIGLMLLQMSWIQNVLKVQKTKYDVDLQNSFAGIVREIKDKLATRQGFNPQRVDWESPESARFFWDQLWKVPSEEINAIIKNELEKNHIDLDFEYAIITSDWNYNK